MFGSGFLARLRHRRDLRRVQSLRRSAERADPGSLWEKAVAARALRHHLNALLHEADARLALSDSGTTAVAHLARSEWSWRPALWRGQLPQPGAAFASSGTSIGDEVKVFHDCPLAELALRQRRQLAAHDPAPYGLSLDVFHFEGTFLSLAVSLPDTDGVALRQKHLVRIDLFIEADSPIKIFARLNIKHGPNTDQLVRTLPALNRSVIVEFDLAYCAIHENRVEAAWVDLIFETPQMNRFTIRDLTMSRQPRAQL